MIRSLVAAPLVGILLWPCAARAQYGPPPPDLPDLMNTRLAPPGHLLLDALFRVDPDDDDARNLQAVRLGFGYGGFTWVSVHYGHTDGAARDDEWEVAGRLVPLSAEVGAPVDFAVTTAWNERARSFDTELSVGVRIAGNLNLIGAIRRFSEFSPSGDAAWAGGGGAWTRVGRGVTVGGNLIVSQEVDEPVWGGQVQARVPGTPIRLAVEVGNGSSTTLHGSAVAGDVRGGLRASIPLGPSRWTGSAGEDAPRTGETDVVAVDTVRVSLGDGGIEPATLRITPGTIVVWSNHGEGVHSATASDGAWASPLLAPGEEYGRVFTEVGTFGYRCQLHPSESGTLEVTGGALER